MATRIELLGLPTLEEIRGGASAELLADLKGTLGLSDSALSRTVGIPRQTMLRRLSQGTLSRHEGDRAALVARVVNTAIEYFDGDRQSAVEWLKSPAPAFDGETPLERSRTILGANEVIDLLGRLAHGIPT